MDRQLPLRTFDQSINVPPVLTNIQYVDVDNYGRTSLQSPLYPESVRFEKPTHDHLAPPKEPVQSKALLRNTVNIICAPFTWCYYLSRTHPGNGLAMLTLTSLYGFYLHAERFHLTGPAPLHLSDSARFTRLCILAELITLVLGYVVILLAFVYYRGIVLVWAVQDLWDEFLWVMEDFMEDVMEAPFVMVGMIWVVWRVVRREWGWLL